MAVRELPALWHGAFGYKPLVAETFADIEAREGTCFKASGRIPLGKTNGYSRHADAAILSAYRKAMPAGATGRIPNPGHELEGMEAERQNTAILFPTIGENV
jgi:hypothetical protein